MTTEELDRLRALCDPATGLQHHGTWARAFVEQVPALLDALEAAEADRDKAYAGWQDALLDAAGLRGELATLRSKVAAAERERDALWPGACRDYTHTVGCPHGFGECDRADCPLLKEVTHADRL